MFAQAIESLLTDHCTPAAVRAIEAGGSAATLATAFDDAGFHALLAPEDQGGGGASWRDGHDVAVLCGAYALPIPLMQTMSARLLVADGQALPEGLISFAPALTREPGGALQAQRVPAGRLAQHVIGAIDGALLLLPVAQAQATPTGVPGSLAASLRWSADAGQPVRAAGSADDLAPLSALLHAGLLAGAMKRVFDMTMGYANDRVQFGKSIGKFQAIQHQLSVMAEHVAASSMAAQAAFNSDARLPAPAACAMAKARTSEAAQLVASIAHAVHGAIGVTAEFDLQLYTRRLHEWRMAHGSETHWNRLLGRLLMQSRAPLVTDFVRGIC